MKKIILSAMLLSLSITSFCQHAQYPTFLTEEDYLNKSVNQKKVASILLIGGTVLIASGLLIAVISNKESDLYIVGLFMGIGAVSTVVSIPFYIASGSNKRKARKASVSLNLEKIQSIQQPRLSYRSVPTISIKLNL